MIFQLALGMGLLIILLSFIFEYIDSSLGMGYGTSLTPILLLLGFNPLQVIPPVLFAQLFAGSFASIMHHYFGNANFNIKSKKKHKNDTWFIHFKKITSNNLKLAILISVGGTLGTLIAVLIAINISAFFLKLYIGILIISMGVFILLTLNKKFKFSWTNVTLFSTLASFNKGLSGGGYGPIITGGQILSGVNTKNAVAITTLAESLTCFIALIIYLVIGATIDWQIAPYLLIGGVLSAPISAYTVKIIKTRKLSVAIALMAIAIGAMTLVRVIA
jgi:uncharacterized protein